MASMHGARKMFESCPRPRMRSAHFEHPCRYGLRALCVAALSCSSIACTREHEPGVLDAAPDLAASVCRYLKRCVRGSLDAFTGGTVESCADVMRQARFGSGVDGAREAQGCAAELNAADCSIAVLSGSAFFGESGPLVAPGPESVCSAAPSPVGASDPEGAPCSSAGRSCGDASYCRLDVPLREADFVACGRCAQSARIGEACDATRPCATRGLQGLCTNGRCLAPLSAACAADAECQSGRCVRGSCAAPHAFLAIANGVQAGKPCGGTAGGACGGDITLVCSDGTCQGRRDLGEPCEVNSSCRLGLACTSGRCALLSSPAGEGEPCGIYNECSEGTFCFRKTCERPAAAGEECAGRSCASGHYCPSCAEQRCRERGADGSECLEDSACSSGFCARALQPHCQTDGLGVTCDLPTCERAPGVCRPRPSADVCK
jgi:hypothetical protein